MFFFSFIQQSGRLIFATPTPRETLRHLIDAQLRSSAASFSRHLILATQPDQLATSFPLPTLLLPSHPIVDKILHSNLPIVFSTFHTPLKIQRIQLATENSLKLWKLDEHVLVLPSRYLDSLSGFYSTRSAKRKFRKWATKCRLKLCALRREIAKNGIKIVRNVVRKPYLGSNSNICIRNRR